MSGENGGKVRLPARDTWDEHGYGVVFHEGRFFALGRNDELLPLTGDVIFDLRPDERSGGLSPAWYSVDAEQVAADKVTSHRRGIELQLRNERGALDELARQLRAGEPDLPTSKQRDGTLTIQDPASTFIRENGLAAWREKRLRELASEAEAAKARIARLEKEVSE